MTITYPNGIALNAMLLSQDEYELRVIAHGGEDVQTFTRSCGAWISEDLEPVTIEFVWQQRRATSAPCLNDCVCDKGLAAHLIQVLFSGCDSEAAVSDNYFAFGPKGNPIARGFSELQAN